MNEIDKKKILEKILESSTFKNSQTYQNLLTFLVNASINNESPKEYDIAIEVFGKDSRFNPAEDPSIRVYISNLRKKLKKYYSEEGKRDRVKLDIPPGHYVVVFNQKKSRNYNKQNLLYVIIAFLLLVIISLIFFMKPIENSQYDASFLKNAVWCDFLKSSNNLLVILGDDYFMVNPKEENKGILRLHDINCDTDLKYYKKTHPELNEYQKTPYTFTPHLSLIPVTKMMPLFCRKKGFLLENSAKMKPAELIKYDILFIGSFRNLYIMKQSISDLVKGMKLGIGSNSLQFADSLKVFTLQGNPQIKHTDYCLFRKIPGPKDNTVIMLVSFFETGMSEASSYVTNPQKLNELNELFKEKYGEMPQYFDCLFRVSGLERTGLTIKIEYFNRIDPQNFKVW